MAESRRENEAGGAKARAREASANKSKAHARASRGNSSHDSPGTSSPPRRASSRGRLVVFGLAALLVLAAGVYLAVAVAKGRSHEVWLINGLPVEYSLTVNGVEHRLPAEGAATVTVGEGEVRVLVVGGELDVPDQTFSIRTPLLSRPFLNRTFVINPDGVAALERGTVFYAHSREQAPDPTLRALGGKTFYSFDNLDYVFEDPPTNLAMPSSKKAVKKEFVRFLTRSGYEPARAFASLASSLDRDVAIRYFQTRVRLIPTEDLGFRFLSSLMEPEAYLAFLRAGLDDRPVRLNIHRFYQSMMDRPEAATSPLEDEYQARLDKEPDNPDLQYLLGRVTRDPRRARQLFEGSISGPRPCPYGYVGLFHHLAAAGEFDKALETIARARDLEPNNPAIQARHRECLLAAGHYDEALEGFQRQCEAEPAEPSPAAAIVDLLFLLGREDEAGKAISAWARAAAPHFTPQGLQAQKDALELRRAYLERDLDRFLAWIGEKDPGAARFWHAVHEGDAAAALQALAAMPQADANDWMLLFIVCTKAGDRAGATRALQTVDPALRPLSWETAVILDTLEGKAKPDPDLLLALALPPQEKALYMTALGVAFPPLQTRFFELARKLNFDQSPPHWYLETVVGKR